MSFVLGIAGRSRTGIFLLVGLLALTACQAAPIAAPTGDTAADGEEASLLVYSGRNENLVGPLLEQYAAASGVDIQVRYGDTAEMAATILELNSGT